MIWSHHIGKIANFWLFLCAKTLIRPPCIDSPSDISISRFGDWIPPWIHIWCSWVRYSPYILMTKLSHTIEPSSFQRMKPYFSIIFFWSSKIDWVMSTIDISSPDDVFTTSFVDVCLRCKAFIESEFMLPCFLWFPPIWEVDSIDVCDSNIKIEYCMNNSSFILDRIAGKIMIDSYDLWCDTIMNPKSDSTISCFLSGMIYCLVGCWVN